MLRGELAAEIWPDADRSTRLRNLRPALNYARSALEGQEAILADDDWLILSEAVETDWAELGRLESRIQLATGADDRLVLLYSLNHLIREPLLKNWDGEWVEAIRIGYDQRRLNILRQLSEELGSRGEWKAALDYARRINELDPTSESGIRLQLRCLGELGRTTEAQRDFALYTKNLQLILQLPVSPGLRQFAKEVIAGRMRKSEARSMTAVQAEMMSEMMGVLAEEEPERLLPLLSSPKLNWSLVFNGSEMRPILERALQATTGWSTARCGAAKRLLQVYTQDREWSKLTELAKALSESDDQTDKIAVLNFQAIERKAALDCPEALALYGRALKIADSIENRYLKAVTLGNRGILNVGFERFGDGRKDLKEALEGLAERQDPNARFGTSLTKGWYLAADLFDGVGAEVSAQNWRVFAETNGTLAYDSHGKLLYGAYLAASRTRGARDWLVAGIDTAFLSRNETTVFESVFPIVFALNALGLSDEAAIATTNVRRIAKKLEINPLPIQDLMLASISASGSGEDLTSLAGVLSFCREKFLVFTDSRLGSSAPSAKPFGAALA